MKSESFDFLNQIISERIHDASILEYLGIMVVELDRINNIVNEFIFIAKPDETIKISRNNIYSNISNIIKFMEPQWNLRHPDYFWIQITSLKAVCDQNLMKQVLINLIQNSFEATDEDSDDIKILFKRYRWKIDERFKGM